MVCTTRFAWLAPLCALACGTTTDDRPATLDYITDAILAPTCATAACHSAFKRAVGDQFDTLEATRLSIVGNHLVAYPEDTGDVANARASYLVHALRVGQPSVIDGDGELVRMPYDAPMAEVDIQLIERWIADGAHGAQCVANARGQGCAVTKLGGITTFQVVECRDGDVGAVVETCAPAQICSFDRVNGQCVSP